MLWSAAEAAIEAHIRTQWAASAYASVPLIFENETPPDTYDRFVYVTVEGVYAEKTIYGGTGKRSAQEAGLVFFHAFVPLGSGKAGATGMVDAMTSALELQTISSEIKMDGGNPPSPAEPGDVNVPGEQPRGSYYRVSGSVPFVVLSTR